MVYVRTEAPRFLVHGCVLRDNSSRQGSLRVVTNSEKKLCFFSLSQIFGVPLHLEVTYAWLI